MATSHIVNERILAAGPHATCDIINDETTRRIARNANAVAEAWLDHLRAGPPIDFDLRDLAPIAIRVVLAVRQYHAPDQLRFYSNLAELLPHEIMTDELRASRPRPR